MSPKDKMKMSLKNSRSEADNHPAHFLEVGLDLGSDPDAVWTCLEGLLFCHKTLSIIQHTMVSGIIHPGKNKSDPVRSTLTYAEPKQSDDEEEGEEEMTLLGKKPKSVLL